MTPEADAALTASLLATVAEHGPGATVEAYDDQDGSFWVYALDVSGSPIRRQSSPPQPNQGG